MSRRLRLRALRALLPRQGRLRTDAHQIRRRGAEPRPRAGARPHGHRSRVGPDHDDATGARDPVDSRESDSGARVDRTGRRATFVDVHPLRLTLPEATALALRQQPTIRSAQGSLTAAQARIPQARSSYFPRFDLQTGVQTSEFKSATTGNRQRARAPSSPSWGAS